jgi:putative flippase GtrA
MSDAEEQTENTRFQFPLYKMFLVVAGYALAFGACSGLGTIGIAISVVVGTAVAGIILLIRNKEQMLSLLIFTGGSVIGAFLTCAFVPMYRTYYHLVDYLPHLCIIAVGAVVGGLLFSWAKDR